MACATFGGTLLLRLAQRGEEFDTVSAAGHFLYFLLMVFGMRLYREACYCKAQEGMKEVDFEIKQIEARKPEDK